LYFDYISPAESNEKRKVIGMIRNSNKKKSKKLGVKEKIFVLIEAEIWIEKIDF
jgi:hypothetical protein